ncbi:MAG TPA: zf-HC2 domain-containing protein [Kofleriaceae bacterium]|jgi:anti-sigma factor RsiW
MSLCQSIETLSMAFLDDELAAEERRELELHLTECTSCRGHLDGERAEHELLARALVAPPAPDLLRARLGRALDAEDAAAVRAERRRWTAWLLPGSSMLAGVAAIAVFIGVLTPTRDHRGAVVKEAVRQQVRTLPLEVQGPRTGQWLEQNASLELPKVREAGSQPIGARLLPRGVNGHDAALVQYQLELGGRPYVLSVVMIRDVRDGDLSDGDEVDVNGHVLHVVDQDGLTAVTAIDPASHVGYAFMAPDLTANELLYVVGRMTP